MDVSVGHARQLFEEGLHQVGAEGAVKPNAEGFSMPDRVPASFDSLTRKSTPRLVGDGYGDDDW